MGETGNIWRDSKDDFIKNRRESEYKRINYAKMMLSKNIIAFETSDDCDLNINLNGGIIKFWAQTGWFCGKKPYGKIKGRGIKNLIKQVKELDQ